MDSETRCFVLCWQNRRRQNGIKSGVIWPCICIPIPSSSASCRDPFLADVTSTFQGYFRSKLPLNHWERCSVAGKLAYPHSPCCETKLHMGKFASGDAELIFSSNCEGACLTSGQRKQELVNWDLHRGKDYEGARGGERPQLASAR